MKENIKKLSEIDVYKITIWKVTFGAFDKKEDARLIIDNIICLYEDYNNLLEKYEDLSKIVYWLSFVDKNIKPQ